MISAYQLTDVTFSHGDTPVLSVKELEVCPGEVVALVGSNGAGKTTLLHLLAFVESPTSGSISFFGQSAERSNEITFRRRVGLLLQHPYLFRSTVLANITWGLHLRRVPRRRSREKAMEALEWVGLSELSHRNARSLSGGEAQRVALARALVLDPEVLLLDEPTNHMDNESATRILEVVRDMNQRAGKTVLFATHRLDEIADLTVNRVLHLADGQPTENGDSWVHHSGNAYKHPSLLPK